MKRTQQKIALVLLVVTCGLVVYWWWWRPKPATPSANHQQRPLDTPARVLTSQVRAAPPTAASIDADKRPNRRTFFAPWGGSNKDQLGHERPIEGNPVGPMSVAHDGKG